MEEAIIAVMARIEAAGGMHQAVADGLVQSMIGASALRFQNAIDSGERKVVGVNLALDDDAAPPQPATSEGPDLDAIAARVAAFRAWKARRPQAGLAATQAALLRAARDPTANLYAEVLAAVSADMTHGEVVATLQQEMGVGVPVLAV
ncbi:MAG: hypothetical protein IPG43_17440 [Proteobacteria bacterium]|nr:hypothetical protein [Pseudomonadota bacterium]